MNQTVPIISLIAALLIFITSIIKFGLLFLSFRLMAVVYPSILPNISTTPWWVYALYVLILISGTMFVYSYLADRKEEKQGQGENE